jgi:hypothetical protein
MRRQSARGKSQMTRARKSSTKNVGRLAADGPPGRRGRDAANSRRGGQGLSRGKRSITRSQTARRSPSRA